jgi:hypothetical protein
MATNKTTENLDSVARFIASVQDDTKRNDSLQLVKIFNEESGFEAKMWGSAIIGFGSYHYKYESGREGDAPLAAFSPRKDALVLYLESVFDNREGLLQKFGQHKTGKACIYIKKLADVNIGVLKELIAASIRHTQAKYG